MSALPISSRLRALREGACAPLPLGWLNFRLDQHPIGYLSPAHARLAREALPELRGSNQALDWDSDGRSATALGARIQFAAESLKARGVIKGWRDERYRCEGSRQVSVERGPALFLLERAAFRFFGLRSRAVHVSTWTTHGQMLVSRRALSKATDPGALDNLAAGGLGAN
ncbi:MAG TPA: DUF4743 domain-containing protein, partial [Burkholderiaceae bacterium]